MDDGTGPPFPGADKRALRMRMHDLWASADLDAVARAAVGMLLDLPEIAQARTVAAYVGTAGEVPTGGLLADLAAARVRVLLPVLLDDSALQWRVHRPGGPLVAGRRGTWQPPDDAPPAALAEADVVIVPGLAYDAAGARLGRGGGSYDRALVEVGPGAVVVALAPDEAVLGHVPTVAHDRRVDVVVTPTRVIRTRRAGC